jgi:16S rRNA (adenine1518-N6/adenine1519-N6)-dimethyltransferase
MMIERISTPARTKEIIKKYDFFFKKNFGQNFLIDTYVLDRIVESADITKEDCVLEVGPGIGSLTQVLAEAAGKVIAVEIDKKLIPILEDTLQAYDNIEIINEDILKLDMDEVIAQKNSGKPIKVVANLPYYITTPIVMGLLEKKLPVESITIMIQKEVADRMQAKPSTKDYGTLSLAVQYYCTPKIVAVAPAHCFMPQPNVDSSVIQLKVLEQPSVSVSDEDLLFKLIKIGFSQRRKTLMNCLNNSPEIKLSKEDIVSAIVEAGFDERIRGEALSLSDFAKLTDILAQKLV